MIFFLIYCINKIPQFTSDIDECANETTNDCSESNNQECINLPGSYVCQCKEGFRENSDDICEGNFCLAMYC